MAVLQGLNPDMPDAPLDAPAWHNLPVHPDALPAPEEGPSQGLAPLFLVVLTRRLYIASGILALAGIGSAIWQREPQWLWVLPMAALLLLGGRPWLRRQFESRRYALRARDITYRRGWLWHRVTTVPYHRIQHGEIAQGPIEKWYGLAVLEVYTAGRNASDLSIPGLPLEEAERLKAFILAQSTGTREEEE